MPRIARSVLSRLLVIRVLAYGSLAAAWLMVVPGAYAGGPGFVAGASYFDPGVKGTPLVWANNTVTYYTDQGDLSPVLPGPSADAPVAAAFLRWTSIPTVALVATQAGQLAEDVSGANVTVTEDGLSLPADIQPSTVSTPVGIVYDADGQVTETLLGTGSSADCLNYAAYGGLDNFATTGNFAHAVVILNGMCVQDSAQLTDFEYRLVRVLGHVLGLDASQANLNVWTGLPVPTGADFAGFPVMHAIDLSYCLPITNCLPVPDLPTMDDRAALGRLYPVTAANQANFPTKSLFSGSTVRIHGVVSFPGGNGAGVGPWMELSRETAPQFLETGLRPSAPPRRWTLHLRGNPAEAPASSVLGLSAPKCLWGNRGHWSESELERSSHSAGELARLNGRGRPFPRGCRLGGA